MALRLISFEHVSYCSIRLQIRIAVVTLVEKKQQGSAILSTYKLFDNGLMPCDLLNNTVPLKEKKLSANVSAAGLTLERRHGAHVGDDLAAHVGFLDVDQQLTD